MGEFVTEVHRFLSWRVLQRWLEAMSGFLHLEGRGGPFPFDHLLLMSVCTNGSQFSQGIFFFFLEWVYLVVFSFIGTYVLNSFSPAFHFLLLSLLLWDDSVVLGLPELDSVCLKSSVYNHFMCHDLEGRDFVGFIHSVMPLSLKPGAKPQ